MEDDILERMFNKHNNNENSEYNSNNNIIKCKFDLESIKHNEEVIQHIEKKKLNKFCSFYDNEESFNENKEHNNDKGDYFSKIKNETLLNSELYCGYLDKITNMNVNAVGKEKKSTLCCLYCFTFISNDYNVLVKELKNKKSIYTCKKTVNTFKDYENKYSVCSLLKEFEFLNESLFPYEDTSQEMFISLKCVNCALILGVYDDMSNKQILFNCI